MNKAITGPIIGKPLYYGKSSRLGVGNFIFQCTTLERIRFVTPHFCTRSLTERLPMKVEVTKNPRPRERIAYRALG